MKSWEELITSAEDIESGYIFAMFTDSLMFEKCNEESIDRLNGEKDKLLDVRVFSEYIEYRAFRDNIGEDTFFYRVSDDSLEHYDERQYLDIDTKRSNVEGNGSYAVWSTGGGRYNMPVKWNENSMIVIRNYVEYYPETGQAYVSDWRLVRLEGGN